MGPKPPHSSTASDAPPDLSILADDAVHLHAVGYTSSPEPSASHERNLVGSMARFRSSPLDFLREISAHVSGSGWRSYDDIVGQPIFYAGFSERMKGMVLQNEMLGRKVRELADRRVEVEVREGGLAHKGGMEDAGDSMGREESKYRRRAQLEEQLMEVADKMTDDMICKMESRRFIRSAYYLCTQLLTRAYHQGESRLFGLCWIGGCSGVGRVDSGATNFFLRLSPPYSGSLNLPSALCVIELDTYSELRC
jgi:hypothetical protein